MANDTVKSALGAGVGALTATNPITAAIPLVTGAIQGISSIAKKRQAQRLQPPAEDIEQRRLLNEIQRQRKAFMTGTAFQQAQRGLRQQAAASQRGALTAGAGPGTIARIARGSQAAFGELAAKGEEQRFRLTQMAADLTQRMAQRRLELGLLQQQRLFGEAAGLRREAFGNILGTVAQNVPVGGATTTPTGGAGGIGNFLDLLKQQQTGTTTGTTT